MRVTQEELRLCEELCRSGIPLDEAVLEEMKTTCSGLVLHQTGTVVDTGVYDLNSGGAGFALCVAICNISNRTLRLKELRVAIPWSEPHFRWLENPWAKMPREYTYSLPPDGPAGFDPEAVLNHRLRPGCKLCPGDPLEGLLLGVGEASIPDQYVDRQAVSMRLSIFDTRGNSYACDVTLMVRREARGSRRQANERLSSERLCVKRNQLRSVRIRKAA